MLEPAVEFRWRRGWLGKATGGAAISAAMAWGMGAAIAYAGYGDFGWDRRALFAGAFAALGALLLGTAITYTIEGIRRVPVVRLESGGLIDRRLAREQIPWCSIRSAVAVQHGMGLLVALEVAAARSVPLPANPVWRVNRLAARLLGRPELMIRISGLDVDLFTLLRAIEDRRGPVCDA